MKKIIDQNILRQLLFITIIVLLALLLFFQLSIFLPALMGAITLYTLFRRMAFYLTEKRNWKKLASTLFIMLISFLGILIPIWLLITMFSSKINYAVRHSAEVINSLKVLVNSIQKNYGIELLKEENLNKLGSEIASLIPQLVGFTLNTLTTILFIFFILYFLLMNSRLIEKAIFDFTPLKEKNRSIINKEVYKMVLSNALGIPLVAIIQGLVGLIGYLIIGVNEPLFWFVVTCVASMIPLIGSAMAYIPLALVLFTNGQNFQAIFILLYGFIVIGAVDNIARFMLQKKIADVHPLITVFGIIIGINLFGFIGLIFGPLLISMFILLLKIYYNEFMEKNDKQETDMGKIV